MRSGMAEYYAALPTSIGIIERDDLFCIVKLTIERTICLECLRQSDGIVRLRKSGVGQYNHAQDQRY